MNKFAILGMAMMAVLAAIPVRAVETENTKPVNVCLQNNRIYGWDVINERLLVVSDLNQRRFVVRLSSGCVGLTNAIFSMNFVTTTNLGCLGQGDRVSFRAPVLGRMTCFVREVDPFNGNRSELVAKQADKSAE